MNLFQKCLVCYQPLDGGLYHSACAKRLFGTQDVPVIEFDQGDIHRLALEIVNHRLALTGVQKKLSLGPDTRAKNGALRRLTIVGYLGGTHILKPPTDDYVAMPELENLTMLLANHCGIKTAAHGLVMMKDRQLAYLTRRFDRGGRRKIAVEDLCQLSEMTSAQKYKSTAERVGKVIRHFSSTPGDDALRYFELTVFSFLSGNADMHMKNFSMTTSDQGRTSLAPAYDLLPTRLLISAKDDPEELTLSVQGKKSSLGRANFMFLGENLRIPPRVIERTLDNFVGLLPKLLDVLAMAILNDDLKARYQDLLQERALKIES